jgi:hypothetical protein
MRRSISILVLLTLTACSVKASHQALDSQTALVGVSRDDLDYCAGLPTKTEKLDDHTELRSYEYKPDNASTMSVNLPVIGGGVTMGGGGDCKATFKMIDGRVAGLRYAGDTDSGMGGRDAVCAPIVAHCLQNLPPRTAPPLNPAVPASNP